MADVDDDGWPDVVAGFTVYDVLRDSLGGIAGLSVGSRGSVLEAEGSLRLHISDRLAVMGGYRHLSLDGKDSRDMVKLDLSGWEFGLEISL